MKVVSRLSSSRSSSLRRLFSTPATGAPQPPPVVITDELEAQDQFNKEKYARMIAPTMAPKTLNQGGGGDKFVFPKNIAEVGVLNSMPVDQKTRTVVISQRVRKSQQSVSSLANLWQISWKDQASWTNPLMGWTSSADPMQSVNLTFDTKEEAIFFAQKSGWKFEVNEPTQKRVVEMGFNTYADTFLPLDVQARMKVEGLKNEIFANPHYGSSHWFQPLKYHGDGEVVQHGIPQTKNA